MTETVTINIDDEVLSKAPTLFVRTKILRDLYFTRSPSPDIEEKKKRITKKWFGVKEEILDLEPLIICYRKLQKQLAGDQRHMLPAVEGMLKRAVLKGIFPTINNLVDSANVVSLTYLIPIGLFDLDQIKGNVTLSLTSDGDEFIPIGKDKPFVLSAGFPILLDDISIFSAVGSRDSKRTMITHNTENALAFSWGIDCVKPNFVSRVLNECAEEILK